MRIAVPIFVFISVQPDDPQKIKTNLHSEKNFVGETSPSSKKRRAAAAAAEEEIWLILFSLSFLT